MLSPCVSMFFFYPKNITHPLIAGEFYYLIGLSAVISCCLFFIGKTSLRVTLFLFNVAFFILAGYPLGSNISIEMFLLVPLLVEAVFLFSFGMSLSISVCLIFVFVFSQRAVTVFGQVTAVPKQSLVIFCGMIEALVLTVCLWIRVLLRKIEYEEMRNTTLDSTIKALTVANRDFQEYAVRARENAETEERKRITREIHDTVGYTFTNISMMMESAIDFLPENPDRCGSLIKKSREQAVKGLEDVRNTLRELRKIQTFKTGPHAVYNLVRTFSAATNIKITIEYGNLNSFFNNEIDSAIYHSVQEGMVNALRHGNATAVKINIWYTGEEIIISILDNGKGSYTIIPGIGFEGLRERLQPLHGTFSANNVYGGFQLQIRIPFRRE